MLVVKKSLTCDNSCCLIFKASTVNIAAATADGESKLALGLFDNRWGDPDRWGCGVVPSAELAPSWESEDTVEAADEAEIELPEERLDAKIKQSADLCQIH